VTLAAVARLLAPADGTPATVVDAGPAWADLPESTAGPVVWGRAPAPSGTGLGAAVAHAARREVAMRRVRSGTVTRWRPPDLGGPPARNAVRAALLAGAVVEIERPAERILDAAAAAAGAGAVGAFRPASGGAILARVDLDGRPALLRASLGGSPGAAALEALAPLRRPAVPELLGRGTFRDASWSVESLLPGRRPGRVTPPLWDACVALCASLPRVPTPEAPRADLDALAAAVPSVATDLARVAAPALERLDRLGGAARHGDLWKPNLLAERGSLTGVVDWDAWHPAAAPGVDLLNLYATERHGPGLGAAWRSAPWRSEGFAAATSVYWDALDLAPSRADLDAIALAWWAGQAAATLRRLPHLAKSPLWVDANVVAAVRSL
jgi:hypothetical protein